MTNPAKTLARGRKITNWLSIALVASVLFNIGTPIFYSIQGRAKDKIVVLDLASGDMLASPIVDPSDSKDILDISASWAVKSILDRSPAGLDNDDLVSVLFNSETGRKVRDEFSGLKNQYVTKNLRSHVEIKSIDAQSIGKGVDQGEGVRSTDPHRYGARNLDPGGASGRRRSEPGTQP